MTIPTTNETVVTSDKRHYLSMAEQIKVADELRKMTDAIEAGKYTLDGLAEILQTELKFRVTRSNVAAILDACEIKRPVVRPRSGGKGAMIKAELDRMLELVIAQGERADQLSQLVQCFSDRIKAAEKMARDAKAKAEQMFDSLEKRISRLEFIERGRGSKTPDTVPVQQAANGLDRLASHTVRKG
jgi:hypothetical protein